MRVMEESKIESHEDSLVSVIMPTWNRARIISRSIQSVLRQTWTEWELLIVDDGSTDDTKDIVEAVGDERIRYIRYEENHGACYARNRGMEQARGEYFAFLDSDNIWDKKFLENRMRRLGGRPHKEVGGAFGCTRRMKGKSFLGNFPAESQTEEIKKARGKKPLIRMMLFDNIMDTNTVVLKRTCAESVGGFCEELGRLQDWEYFFRVLCNSGYRLIFCDDCLVTNYVRRDSISRKGNDAAYWHARGYFLMRHAAIFRQYNCLEEACFNLFTKTIPTMTQKEFLQLAQTVGDQEVINRSFWRLRQMYLEQSNEDHGREKKMRRLGIFQMYDKDGIVEDYITYLLEDICQNLQELIVVTCGELRDAEKEKLYLYTDRIYYRGNYGYDAYAFRDTIVHYLGTEHLKEYDELLLFNDTFYGPIFPFAEVFTET